MSVPFRLSKHQGTAPQRSDSRASKRQVFQSFIKNNASKLRRSSNSKREVQTQTQQKLSQRRSQTFNIPTVVIEADREPAILHEWASKSVEIPRPSKDSVAGSYYAGIDRKPSTAKSSQPRTSPKLLTEEDITRFFSGAPKFETRGSQKLPRPKVSYHGKLDEENVQLRDYTPFTHSTFAAATLENHEVTNISDADSEQTLLDTDISLMEVPSMMSLNGSEPGTVGLEYFIQMPISDSRLSTEDDDDLKYKHQILATSPEELGLRTLDLEALIDRLTELGDARQSGDIRTLQYHGQNEQKAAEMHADLFSRLLVTPEIDSNDEADVTNFDSQIQALVEVLDTPEIWYDFSRVENRIRLGQMLWPSYDDDEWEPEEEEPSTKERDVVLLQITLACELLIRLEFCGINTASTSRKVNWDLVLALRFLHNLRIAPKASGADGKQYRNSVFSIATFVTARESLEERQIEPILYPRHEKQQLDGLFQFAEALSWPHYHDIKKRFEERVRRHSDGIKGFDPYATLVRNPSQATAIQAGNLPKRPQVGRTATAQSIQLLPASAYVSESFDAGGWLSRSWLTGFVLPGESISHLLISTLLENSPPAVQALGDSANLYGGFVYNSRSYWSKNCVVGRVIAAANGAADCMGWISASSAPVDHKNGWVNLEVKDLPSDATLRVTDTLSKDSAFVRRADGSTTITDAEFTWPVDGLPVLGNEARYHGFTLQPTGTSFELTTYTNDNGLSAIPTSVACLDFSAKRNFKPAKVTIPLLYDVYFISAYPCFPRQTRSPRPSSPCQEKELPEPPCHPLHVEYSIETIPAATILADEFTDTVHLGDETVVLDCRGTGELQLLARAWCAKVGENALVARTGRTCLSCCVREANGLGLKVVIRI